MNERFLLERYVIHIKFYFAQQRKGKRREKEREAHEQIEMEEICGALSNRL